MKKLSALNIVNAVITLAVITVNALANILPLNGLTTGDIADRFDIYFVPAGYVFSIWSVIYVGVIAYTVYQLLPAHRSDEKVERIGYLYALSGVANIAWLFLWHYEIFPLTIVAMLLLLGSLIAIYLRAGIGESAFTSLQRWTVQVPFSIYLGWVSVATVANATQLLDYFDWNRWGLSAETWAILMLVVAAAIALAVIWTRRDAAYGLVFVWAYVGIAIKHASTPPVAIPAGVLAGIIALVILVRSLLRSSTPQPQPVT